MKLFASSALALTFSLAPSLIAPPAFAGESHLAGVRQLTFGGENAEAYWAPDGRELIFQSTRPPHACDQIFRVAIDGRSEARLVSSGQGRTTCSYFAFPAGERIYYSSTHAAGGAACPPVPDRSKGYVWPIYSAYEIYSAKPDGSDLRKLTDNQAYDAEATVCPTDGTILFTSTRDGDLDLYTMKPDGSDVKRLTREPGYDGGAFFSNDCSQIVWRASRPHAGRELDEFRQLLAEGLVRPSKLEIMVANADGSNARQVTYLDAASFAPSFFPDGKRILFSSNTGDPKGREFDIWAVDVDGGRLERITDSPGFDGFPLFSPDGKTLAFASNRNQAKPGETNVFVATWKGGSDAADASHPSAADRFRDDVDWLAADERDGRGIGTAGLAAAGEWIETQFRAIGLEPAGESKATPPSYRQTFPVLVAVERGPKTTFRIDGVEIDANEFVPIPFSSSSSAEGEIVAAGYGIAAPDLGHDDYAGLDVRGKIVAVRRFTPDSEAFKSDEMQRRHGDLRAKAFAARERGAIGLIAVDAPVAAAPSALATGAAPAGNPHAGAPPSADPGEAELPHLRLETGGDSGIPVIAVRRSVGERWFSRGTAQSAVRARVEVQLARKSAEAFNVLGRLAAGAPDRLPGVLVVGAHYDHLGHGGRGSLEPDSAAIHNGADDNASGVAAVLETARRLATRRSALRRDVIFVAFSGEESGVLGSGHWVKTPSAGVAIGDLVAMLNFDMVGRLRDNQVSVLGGESAAEWKDLLTTACDQVRLRCSVSGDGYGPSDHSPFYAAGVPVLHFFSGVHSDYHKPSDDSDRLNAIGGAKIAELAADVALATANQVERPTYKSVPAPAPSGDVRASGGSLGTVPDYAGDGRPGMLLAGVRAGGPAEQAGLRRGDLIVELSGKEIRGVEDLMYVLRTAKAGEQTIAVVERDGKRVELLVTYGPPMRMR